MGNALHSHAAEALKALRRPDPEWVSITDHWLELSLAAKGTAWEAAVECLGEALLLRDADVLDRGLMALQNSLP